MARPLTREELLVAVEAKMDQDAGYSRDLERSLANGWNFRIQELIEIAVKTFFKTAVDELAPAVFNWIKTQLGKFFR